MTIKILDLSNRNNGISIQKDGPGNHKFSDMGYSKSKLYFIRCLPVSNARHMWQRQLEVGVWHQGGKSCIEIYLLESAKSKWFFIWYHLQGEQKSDKVRLEVSLELLYMQNWLMKRKTEVALSEEDSPCERKRAKQLQCQQRTDPKKQSMTSCV